jgi:hypothetical protein
MAKKRAGSKSKEPSLPQKVTTLKLIELKPGLFLNEDHIVSVRILVQQEGDAYAILQLSNGDKLSLTRDEFTAISGVRPLPPARLSQKLRAE